MRKIIALLLTITPALSYCQSISIANTSVVEGNGGQKTIEVMVTISPVSKTAVDVSYQTGNGNAAAGSDYVAAKGSLHFNPGETMKKITVVIKGDNSCEPTESFDIVLSNATGATILDGTGTVSIINDDCLPASGPALYEIRLTCTGYTSFSVGPPECPIRSNGKVVLYGIVSGRENVAADDDINYRGTMQLDIDMDICSIKRDNNGEDHLCGMTINGSGQVEVELEIRFDARGGYIQFENKGGKYIRALKGNCQQDEMDEELTMIPNKTIASIFNGFELPSLTNRTLTVGTYNDGSGVELKVVTEVLRKLR